MKLTLKKAQEMMNKNGGYLDLIITGACKQGTDNFISGLKEIKESYTISEYIKMTKGQYMSEVFERFFKA